jgi:hypothetical protein
LLAGKQSWMTLRDLFRWAQRYHSSEDQASGTFYDYNQLMADQGMLDCLCIHRNPILSHICCYLLFVD